MKALEIFGETLYKKFRGVIEGIFGDWKQEDCYSRDIRKSQ